MLIVWKSARAAILAVLFLAALVMSTQAQASRDGIIMYAYERAALTTMENCIARASSKRDNIDCINAATMFFMNRTKEFVSDWDKKVDYQTRRAIKRPLSKLAKELNAALLLNTNTNAPLSRKGNVERWFRNQRTIDCLSRVASLEILMTAEFRSLETRMKLLIEAPKFDPMLQLACEANLVTLSHVANTFRFAYR